MNIMTLFLIPQIIWFLICLLLNKLNIVHFWTDYGTPTGFAFFSLAMHGLLIILVLQYIELASQY